jgi:hypothetical protein
MNERLISEEQYKKGNDVINYVVYKSTTGPGNDEVLQHKLFGTTETAHVTLHPDGTVNLRIKRTDAYMKMAIKTNFIGFEPELSQNVRRFLSKVHGKI